ncbi:MAG: hypothetical protein WDZ51_03185 [Pirellulaceae bacterium]
MTRIFSIAMLMATLIAGGLTHSAQAGHPWSRTYANNASAYHAAQAPWHGAYAYQNYGTPLAQVVPPTAAMQSSYGWGVPSSRMTPIHHQFNSQHPGGMTSHGNLRLTPVQPTHTSQFGVYYVRGPWGYAEGQPTAAMYHGLGHSLHHGGHSQPILPGVIHGRRGGAYGYGGVRGGAYGSSGCVDCQ